MTLTIVDWKTVDALGSIPHLLSDECKPAFRNTGDNTFSGQIGEFLPELVEMLKEMNDGHAYGHCYVQYADGHRIVLWARSPRLDGFVEFC